MKIRWIIGAATIAASLACSGAWAWDQDPAAQYFERKDTIVSGAGDARDVNAATHIIDPWPRYVGDRRIPANGDRMSRAVERLPLSARGRARVARVARTAAFLAAAEEVAAEHIAEAISYRSPRELGTP